MFKYSLSNDNRSPDFILTLLLMSYIAMVVLSIILFEQILKFNAFGVSIEISGSVVPYVFLYPISFIVLRLYGLKKVNHMILSMILVSFIFVIMSKIVVGLSSNVTEIHSILSNSLKMYLAGCIGMPAGIYTSFLTINLLGKIGLNFSVLTLSIATITGEIINTIIVFPIGFHGRYSLYIIFSKIIIDAMFFKVFMGAILACITILTINLILNRKIIRI